MASQTGPEDHRYIISHRFTHSHTFCPAGSSSQATLYLVVVVLCGVTYGGYWIFNLWKQHEITLKRTNNVITSSAFPDLPIGDHPKLRVRQTTRKRGQPDQKITGYEIDWIPNGTENQSDNSSIRLVDFKPIAHSRVRQFAEQLCKLSGADLHWENPKTKRDCLRSSDELDLPLHERLSPSELPDCPQDPDRYNIKIQNDKENPRLSWRPGMNKMVWVLGTISLVGAIGLFLAEYSGLIAWSPIQLIIAGTIPGIGLLLLGGNWLVQTLLTRTITVSPENIQIQYRTWGLVPTEQQIDTNEIEEIIVDRAVHPTFANLVLVGDDLYLPIGNTMYNDEAHKIRALFLHALVSPSSQN